MLVRAFILFVACVAAAHAQTPSPSLPPSSAPQPFHEVIENKTRHWSLTLPPGWSLAPQETVDAIDAQIARLLPDRDFACVAVLWADDVLGMSGPYVQVHAVSRDPRLTTLDQIEQSLADAKLIDDARRRERAAAGLTDDQASESPPILDRARLRITSEGRLTIPSATPGDAPSTLRFLSTGVLGSREITKLILYAPDDQTPSGFDAVRPLYAAALDSFAYDPGWEFSGAAPTPASQPAARPFSFLGLPPGAAALLGIAVLVVTVKLLWRRQSKVPQ
jgi:hypothetical protein